MSAQAPTWGRDKKKSSNPRQGRSQRASGVCIDTRGRLIHLTEEVDVVHANIERSVDLELELPAAGVRGVERGKRKALVRFLSLDGTKTL